MAVGGLFRFAKQALFSQPTPERQLLKLAKSSHSLRVVELGIESLESTSKLLKQIASQPSGEEASYTGFDAFDERAASDPRLSLIDTHRELSATGVSVRLQPGGPTAGVPALANSLQDSDLVLISLGTSDRQLESAWFFLPRMCHPGTLVLRRTAGEEPDSPGQWTPLPHEEINRLATLAEASRAA